MIQIKRVYEKYYVKEGLHVLIDRLWPRGVRKSTPNVDVWMRRIAPSDELRKWYIHEPGRWEEFRKRYKKELDHNPKEVQKLLELVSKNYAVTLVYATKDEQHNNAIVLKEYMEHRLAKFLAQNAEQTE